MSIDDNNSSDCVWLVRVPGADEAVGADRAGSAGEEPSALRPPPPQHALPPVSQDAQVHRCQACQSLLRKGEDIQLGIPISA